MCGKQAGLALVRRHPGSPVSSRLRSVTSAVPAAGLFNSRPVRLSKPCPTSGLVDTGLSGSGDISAHEVSHPGDCFKSPDQLWFLSLFS